MSVQLTRKPFGEYELLVLGNEDTFVSFVPCRSAYVHQVRINGRDLLWNYLTGKELSGNSAYRNPALLPFPNRLLNGEYTWADATYSFEINNPESQSALHGFGPDVPFSVERYDLDESKAEVKLTYLNQVAEYASSYPFLVRFEVVLGVDLKAKTASWTMSATNLESRSTPIGLGWHPYFLLPGGLDKWNIQMPPNEHVQLKNMIPNGERGHGLSPKQATAINPNWDDCFAMSDPNSLEVKLLGPQYSLLLKQTGQTRYTQLYVPEENNSIAVEPMTCGVNAFNATKREVEVAAGGSISTGMEIALHPSGLI